MTRIVSIKFRNAGKQYDFLARDMPLDRGNQVVVETDRGRALGIVVAPPFEREEADLPKGMKNVLRLASEEDVALANTNASREESALRYCRIKVQERHMEMKLVKAEYLFDGSKIVFYFTADGRIDFRELVKDLAHYFHTRIEMRQIGVRDEAKLVGGIGICGRELCCCSYMTDFAPVSVKMAKEQQLALNPTKISGQCGRLLCCLGYEYETYCALRKGMPKTGTRLTIDGHTVQISDVNILGQKLSLRIDDGRLLKLSRDEFEQLLKPDATLPEPEMGRSRRPEPSMASSAQKPEKESDKSGDSARNRPRRRRKPGGGDATRQEATPETTTSTAAAQPAQPAAASAGPDTTANTESGDAASASKRRRRRRGRRKPKTEHSEP
jgi:cell fate regulator YaaT (PSP1 superfamily)